MAPVYRAPPTPPEDPGAHHNHGMDLKLSLPVCTTNGLPIESPLAIPTSFDDLVEDVRRILGDSSGIDSDDVDVDELMDAMRAYNSCQSEWEQYALRDKSRAYTRNGVDDINSKANLLILVWNPGRGSLIHDHANAHCIVKVLKGSIRETQYEWPSHPDEELHVKSVKDYGVDQVSYMSDSLGLHRMENTHSTDVAVSLHLYTPPYAAKFGCHIYDENSGKSTLCNLSTLYSWKGVKCSTHGDSC